MDRKYFYCLGGTAKYDKNSRIPNHAKGVFRTCKEICEAACRRRYGNYEKCIEYQEEVLDD